MQGKTAINKSKIRNADRALLIMDVTGKVTQTTQTHITSANWVQLRQPRSQGLSSSPRKGTRDAGNEVATERGFQSGPFLWCRSQAKKSKRDFYFYTYQDETVYLRYT